MDKELKQKWVDALRSGKFKQAKNKLYNEKEDSYCCLGVFCVVSGKDIVDEHSVRGYDRYDYFLKAVAKDYDILTEMNDGGKSFSEIADWIENNL